MVSGYVASMRIHAARLLQHGKPLHVEEIDLADPGPDEAVVDLAYGGVNPVDRYGALGRVAPDGPLPRTLGTEASGRVGDRPVMVRGHGLGTGRDGLWATRAVVPKSALIDVPEGVDLPAAAAMGVAGVTAWRTVTEKARVGPEDRVLVLGASGGVGSIAVSVAASLGATVWGQTGSDDKAEWVRRRGAHRVVVGGAGPLVEAAGDLHPTVVIDPLGDGFTAAAIELLEERGRLVIFGTSADAKGEISLQDLYRKGLTVMGYAGLIEEDETMNRHVADALGALRDGRLQVVVDRTVPLQQVNDALTLLEQREISGKLVLELGARST